MGQHRTTDQQLADAEARIARLRKRQRSEDTRRKILVGAMMLGRAETDPQIQQAITQALDNYLADNRDRKLFNLPPRINEA